MELSSFWEESQSRVHSLFCTDGADAASTESLWFFFHSYFLPGTSWGDVFVCVRVVCMCKCVTCLRVLSSRAGWSYPSVRPPEEGAPVHGEEGEKISGKMCQRAAVLPRTLCGD